MGMKAQKNVSNKAGEEGNNGLFSISAFASQSCDQLLNLAIDVARSHPHLAAAVHNNNNLKDAHTHTNSDGNDRPAEEEKGHH
jgi:hypothetical protein